MFVCIDASVCEGSVESSGSIASTNARCLINRRAFGWDAHNEPATVVVVRQAKRFHAYVSRELNVSDGVGGT